VEQTEHDNDGAQDVERQRRGPSPATDDGAAWTSTREDRLVDKLAAEHPEYAEELYEFFADLVEAEQDYNYRMEHRLS